MARYTPGLDSRGKLKPALVYNLRVKECVV